MQMLYIYKLLLVAEGVQQVELMMMDTMSLTVVGTAATSRTSWQRMCSPSTPPTEPSLHERRTAAWLLGAMQIMAAPLVRSQRRANNDSDLGITMEAVECKVDMSFQ